MTDTSPLVGGRTGPQRLRSSPSGIPIVSIAGARGKSTVAWMLNDILAEAGWSCASWLSSGVYVDGALQEGELGPWSKVVLAARYGELDLVIQELTASTVIGAGLPRDTYPLGVVTTLCGNNEACLLSDETRRERLSLKVVVESIHSQGRIVANADDYDVIALVETSPAEIVYFALHHENPTLQRHLASGGAACWLEEGWLRFADRGSREAVMPISEVKGTLDGEILFQVQNALAAASVAMVIGVDPWVVRHSLSRFEPRPDRQPASCNIVRFNDATIVIDSPSQVSSLKLLARGLRHTPHRRTLVVSGCFPGLTDADSVEAGRIVGGLGGIVLLHGERASDERMRSIRSGLAAALPPPIVLGMPSEGQALDQLLNTVAPGDLALVLADDPTTALDRLWPAPRIDANRHRSNGKKV